MSLTRIAIDTNKLCKGMYVAKLDRPWVETPFVFQGFEINGHDDIEQLQLCCSYVYVDIERGKLSEAEIRSLLSTDAEMSLPVTRQVNQDAPSSGLLKRFFGRLFQRDSANDASIGGQADAAPYQITSTVRREAPAAKEAYEHALLRHKAILERARGVGEVSFEKASKAVKPIIESILRNPDAMAWTVFSKKRSARNYSRAVATAVWCAMYGRYLGFGRTQLQELAIGGLLLDIGNVGVPDEIVNAEGSITITEFNSLSRHVRFGLQILKSSGGFSESILEMVQFHHERADGSGYPGKKAGNHIPVFGRIAGVADCYDAMTTKTAYSPAVAAYDSARELNDMRGKEFQAEVVGQFLKMIGMFPTGSVVEFSDGIVGVVLEQNRSNPLRPKVMLLRGSNGQAFDQPQVLDMQKLPGSADGSKVVSIAKGHEHGAFGIDPFNYFT